jgi:hypothetical protein
MLESGKVNKSANYELLKTRFFQMVLGNFDDLGLSHVRLSDARNDSQVSGGKNRSAAFE